MFTEMCTALYHKRRAKIAKIRALDGRFCQNVNPSLDGRLGHTGSAIIMKTGQANHLKALTVQWTEIFSCLLDKRKTLQGMNKRGHQEVLGRQL